MEKLHEKQIQEEETLQELEGLKESLETSKNSLAEVTNDRDRLTSLCSEKDNELQVELLTLDNFIVRVSFLSLQY
jgi:hypothetical protein